MFQKLSTVAISSKGAQLSFLALLHFFLLAGCFKLICLNRPCIITRISKLLPLKNARILSVLLTFFQNGMFLQALFKVIKIIP